MKKISAYSLIALATFVMIEAMPWYGDYGDYGGGSHDGGHNTQYDDFNIGQDHGFSDGHGSFDGDDGMFQGGNSGNGYRDDPGYSGTYHSPSRPFAGSSGGMSGGRGGGWGNGGGGGWGNGGGSGYGNGGGGGWGDGGGGGWGNGGGRGGGWSNGRNNGGGSQGGFGRPQEGNTYNGQDSYYRPKSCRGCTFEVIGNGENNNNIVQIRRPKNH